MLSVFVGRVIRYIDHGDFDDRVWAGDCEHRRPVGYPAPDCPDRRGDRGAGPIGLLGLADGLEEAGQEG